MKPIEKFAANTTSPSRSPPTRMSKPSRPMAPGRKNRCTAKNTWASNAHRAGRQIRKHRQNLAESKSRWPCRRSFEGCANPEGIRRLRAYLLALSRAAMACASNCSTAAFTRSCNCARLVCTGDRCGDAGPGNQPGQRHLCRRGAQAACLFRSASTTAKPLALRYCFDPAAPCGTVRKIGLAAIFAGKETGGEAIILITPICSSRHSASSSAS